jgi:hypothetical protein
MDLFDAVYPLRSGADCDAESVLEIFSTRQVVNPALN